MAELVVVGFKEAYRAADVLQELQAMDASQMDSPRRCDRCVSFHRRYPAHRQERSSRDQGGRRCGWDPWRLVRRAGAGAAYCRGDCDRRRRGSGRRCGDHERSGRPGRGNPSAGMEGSRWHHRRLRKASRCDGSARTVRALRARDAFRCASRNETLSGHRRHDPSHHARGECDGRAREDTHSQIR